MVPFAGYAMPVHVPRRHHRRAPALPRVGGAVRRLAHGPAAPGRRRCRGGARDAGAGRRRRPGAGQAALRAASPNDDGGILDDLMIDDAATTDLFADRQRRLQGGRHRAHLRARIGHRCQRACRCPSTRCSRCRGRRPPPRWRAWRPSVDEARLHDRRRGAHRRRRLLRHALAATPARTASRSRSPRREAEALARALLAAARGQARRPGRARHAAARSRPVPLRPRHRHHDHAGRGRPRPGRSRRCAAPAARAPAASRARPGDRGAARGTGARDASASAWSAWSACRCAKARRSSTSHGRALGHVTSGTARPDASTGRSRWPTSPPRYAAPGTTRPRRRARQAASRWQSAAMPFAPHRYYRG